MFRYLPLVLLILSENLFAQNECIPTITAPHYADTQVQATGASGAGFGNPMNALNGVYGAGANAGGFDVFSLNFASDGILIASFSQGRVCNTPGPDFNVFENGFQNAMAKVLFFEPVVVSVSLNGIDYIDFPHQYIGTSSLVDIVNPVNWQGFAGMTPVLYNESTNNFSMHGVDPLDPAVAGGDAFDIDNLPDTELGLLIKTQGFRYLKLTAAPKLGFPNSPNSFGGFADIDGIYAKAFAPTID